MTEKTRQWTIAETAERFDVHIGTVLKWIHAGHLPGAHKKGPGRTSPFVIPESSIVALEDKLKQGTAEV